MPERATHMPHPERATSEPLRGLARLRWARPTDRFEQVVAFYRDALGLPVLSSFSGHAGYSGVILGLPDAGCQLEFTEHDDGSPCPAPTADNLLVLYMDDRDAHQALVERMQSYGHEPVVPENPYWEHHAATFADPDGWRVVVAIAQHMEKA
jgi:catechol 2,3-dioxygenase-like lactoylglutathione lyase family enzyme